MQMLTFGVQPPMRFRFGFAENVVLFLTAGRDCLTAGRPSDGDLLSRFFFVFLPTKQTEMSVTACIPKG